MKKKTIYRVFIAIVFQLAFCFSTQATNLTIVRTVGSDTVCQGQTVTFVATDTVTMAAPGYQWYLNGTAVSGATSTTFTSSSLTSGSITCIVTPDTLNNPSVNETSNTLAITVLPNVAPTISIPTIYLPPSTCAGNVITFNANITDGGTHPSYQWHINGNNAGTDTANFSTMLPLGTDIISCTLTSNQMCVSPTTATSNSVAINVTNGPVINYVTNQNVCGGIIAPTNLSSNPSGASYHWTNSNTAIGLGAFGSGSNVPSYTAVNGTSFPVQSTVTVTPYFTTNFGTCEGTPSSYVITVNPTPTILQNGTYLTTYNICQGCSYQWFRNNLPIQGADSTSYKPVESGNYSLIISNSPCSSNVIINTTGIEEENNPYRFELYPNPTGSVCTISFNAVLNTDYKLELRNALGALVYSEVLDNFSGLYTKQLSFAEYGNGIYFVSIGTAAGKTVKRIVVY